MYIYYNGNYKRRCSYWTKNNRSIVAILLVFIFLLLNGTININKGNDTNDNGIIQNTDNNASDNPKSTENTQDIKPTVDEKFANYLVDELSLFAGRNKILKATQGDITAPKLTQDEVKNNSDFYKENFTNALSYNMILPSRFNKKW